MIRLKKKKKRTIVQNNFTVEIIVGVKVAVQQ